MTRTATWAGIGTDVRGCNDVASVLEKAKLDFEVTTQPLVTESGIIVPNKVATVATVNGESKVLGVVSEKYNICQNYDAFNFVDGISDELSFQKAGMTQTGMIYVIGVLPQVTVLGDSFSPYVILQNSFNGEYSLKATICPVRIVCQNQFSRAFGHSNNNVSILHSSNMMTNLEQAQILLKGVANYMEDFEHHADIFASMKLNSSPEAIIDAFFRASVEGEVTERVENRIHEQTADLLHLYDSDDNQNFKGTAWGLINAFSDFDTHQPIKSARSSEDSKFLAVTFNPVKFKQFVDMVSAHSH